MMKNIFQGRVGYATLKHNFKHLIASQNLFLPFITVDWLGTLDHNHIEKAATPGRLPVMMVERRPYGVLH